MATHKIVSRHYFRRRARASERKLSVTGLFTGAAYRVERSSRGPHRWQVVRTR